MTLINKIKDRLLRFNKKVDDYHETITFSEAGIQARPEGREILTCAGNTGHNLVVASQESRFPDDMMAYALEMAQRMDYDIIAVNAANLTPDVTEFFSSTHNDLYKHFEQDSVANAEVFREKAEALGLKFAHVTNYADVDHALSDITKECGQVEFVITENREKARIRETPESTQRIAQRLCVYSVN